MMDPSHPLYALNASDAAALVDQSSVGLRGEAAQFSTLSVIEHLQNSLRHEHERRLELEKELAVLRKRYRELEASVAAKEDRSSRGTDLHQAHLRSIKSKLERTLKSASSPPPPSSHLNHNQTNSNSSYELELIEIDSPRRIEFDHRCDECSFHSKSDVSLILHKMNHSIVEQQYVLSSTSFTTRNSNSKNVYNCPACDTGLNMTRHEVYRHIYDSHTNEKPLPCPYCEYSFTLKEYLDDHVRSKHAKVQNQKVVLRPDAILNNSLLSSETTWSTKLLASATATTNPNKPIISLNSFNTANNHNNQLHHNQLHNHNQSNSNSIATIITPTIKTKAPGRGRPPGSGSAKSGTELKCTFLDCNFGTISQDKLDFHMKAHINTKYKCPYCPYVSNTIIDIKRHIQKSKKHEGMKMYSCQKCGFGADCDRMFKEHLRAYHFGYEVHDTVVDYFIEEMFSNKNNKRPGEEDGLGQAQLAQLQAQLQNPVLHHPPMGGDGGHSAHSHHPPPMKKLASSLAAAAERKQRGSVASASSTLTTMIEENDSSVSTPGAPSTPSHLQQQQQQQQQQSSMESLALISNYRQQQQQNSATNSPVLSHQQTNQLVNSLGLNAQNASVLMYHSLHDLASTGGGGGSTQNHHHQQQNAQQQQQHHQTQFQQHHNLANLGTIPSSALQQQQQQAHHGAESLIVQQVQQQQQRQQQVPSRPQSQQAQNGPFGASLEPNALQQYVSYANY